jgi:hypothetical protein
LFCGVCQRRMQGQWVNQAPYYRCRFPVEYALANKLTYPRNVYLSEDDFDTQVHDWIAGLFAPGHLDRTIDLIMAGQDAQTTAQTCPRSPNGSPRHAPSGSAPKRNSAAPPAPATWTATSSQP